MKVIKVKASRNYEVNITNGYADFESKVLNLITGNKVAIITDSNVSKLYLNEVKSLIKNKVVKEYIIQAGEESKNFENYQKLINCLAKDGFSRKDCIIALGGGVVGDMAGFVSATYMRGINFIQMPTSLLAMVDSSIGGKTAIDLDYGKNLCGAFYQPLAVYINLDYLKSLPNKEVLCGYGEIIKCSILNENYNEESLVNDYLEVVYNAVDYKRYIVEIDEFEKHERKLLNLGHTIGHAIEKLSNYTLSHGECVVKGIYAILKISQKYYNLDSEQYEKVLKLLKIKDFNLDINYDILDIVEVIKMDKKSDGESVDLVLINNQLKVVITPVKISKIVEYLK